MSRYDLENLSPEEALQLAQGQPEYEKSISPYVSKNITYTVETGNRGTLLFATDFDTQQHTDRDLITVLNKETNIVEIN